MFIYFEGTVILLRMPSCLWVLHQTPQTLLAEEGSATHLAPERQKRFPRTLVQFYLQPLVTEKLETRYFGALGG